MYSRIPAELRSLKQWILWNKNKVPYQINGNKADVTNPNTWSTFDSVVKYLDGFSGIGFVFSNNDQYTGIDLDYNPDPTIVSTQLKIFNEFDSYSEISPSGKGLHIIVKGIVPSGGRKNSVEVYSFNRFFTMTGNVYHDKPIEERQVLLTQLWEQMKPNASIPTQQGDQDEKYSDAEIIEQASKAENGNKFKQLLSANWQNSYPSQSEADFAFIDIISFYTKNRNQIQRIFRQSRLGFRSKAKRKDYVNGMIDKSFDQTLPPLDFSGFKVALDRKLEEQNGQRNKNNGNGNGICETFAGLLSSNKENSELSHSVLGHQSTNNPCNNSITIPLGLIGEIARFIYAAAPKPVPEIAIAGAFGLMAGICGRAYNVSSTGLNQYILLLAPTGTGKEAMSTGIDRLMSSVKKSVITAGEFVGPSEIASGQALVRYMDKTSKCFVSLFDEFGHRLQAMANPKAHNAELVLQRKLLEVYQKSGRGQEWQPSVYADAEKNTKIIQCPAMSILGYCTPEKLYAELNEEMITDGLLPRFSIIEYNGTRPETNYNHAFVQPSSELTNQIADLCKNCLALMHGSPQRWIDISFNQESWNLSNAFDKQCDAEINKTNKEIYRRLWTRAHLKALKIAGLIAVGCNYLMPTITVEHLQYAIDMVTHDIVALTAKFESGETGKNTDEIKQHNELLRTATEFFTQDWEKIASYCPSSYALYKMKLIPKEYFNSRTKKLAAFKNDKRGATVALDRAIKTLVDDGKLVDYTKHQNYKLLATTKMIYAPTPDLLA